jgi:signal transduction histidine kinase
MSSPIPSRPQQKVAFRITAWHTVIYLTSLIALFVVAHFTLSRLLRERDLRIVSNELRAVSEEYGEKGVPEVAKYVTEGHSSSSNLVRVASADNETLYASPLTPANTVAALEKATARPQAKRRFLLRTPGGDDFEVETATLSDGTLLQAGLSTRPRKLFLTRFLQICGAFMVPIIAFGIFGGMLFAGRTLRPLHDLRRTVRRILRTGKLDERITVQRAPSDLMELVRSFNQMLGRIETLVGSIRNSVDNVAHELRTPMTRLRGTAEAALRDSDNIGSAQSALGNCVEECDHVMSLLDVLMDLAEAEAGVMKIQPQPTDLRLLIRKVADLYEVVADDKALKISVEMPAGLTVNADSNRLPQAVANLVDNAVKYTPNGGQITISGWRANGEVAVSVKDTGIGISSVESEKIWERLYRADKSRSEHGLGLGLTVVKAIVEAHHGRVTLESELNRGSVFTVYLPAV